MGREVTVMVVDSRDFTPFAEANTADVAERFGGGFVSVSG
jgi:class 3 adenylate cyclase